ncbi:hypothetical protein ACWFPY_17235 [Nocardia fluminea]
MAFVEAGGGAAMSAGRGSQTNLTELAAELEAIAHDQRQLRQRVKSVHAALVSMRALDLDDFDRSDLEQVDAFLAGARSHSARQDLGCWIRCTVQMEGLLISAQLSALKAEVIGEQGLMARRESRRSR